MKIVVVVTPVGQSMDGCGIAVPRKNDWTVLREKRIEFGVGEAVRVDRLREETHHVDDVHEAHRDLGEMLSDQVRGGKRFQCRHVARTGQYDIGLLRLLGGCPFPHADTACAVSDRLLNVEVVQRRLFARDNDIDVLATP